MPENTRACDIRLLVTAFTATLSITACGSENGDGDTAANTDGETDSQGSSGGSDGSSSSGQPGSESGAMTDSGPDTDSDGTDSTTGGAPGDPLPDAPPGEWLWVPIEGAICRDGSPAGLAVRYSDTSTNVAIYFEGGGACYNVTTCFANPASVGSMSGGNSGLFNRDHAANPVADWNHVFIPYCTGDVFAGNNPGGNIPGGPQNQMFVGYVNTGLMFERIVPTFPDAEHVLLAGSSAGGFGAAYNYDRAAKMFGDIVVTMLDDSGPPMADQYMKPCMQQQWRDVWGLDSTLPEDCDECFHRDGGGLVYLVPYLAEKYPDRTLALISSEEDSTISGFWAYGENDCDVVIPSPNAAAFKEGLYDLRDNWLAAEANWGSYFITGSTHVWLASDSRFYGTTVSDVVLADWATGVLAGSPAHVSP